MSIFGSISGVGSAGVTNGVTKEYIDAQDTATEANAATLDNLHILK